MNSQPSGAQRRPPAVIGAGGVPVLRPRTISATKTGRQTTATISR